MRIKSLAEIAYQQVQCGFLPAGVQVENPTLAKCEDTGIETLWIKEADVKVVDEPAFLDWLFNHSCTQNRQITITGTSGAKCQ